jgi:hypothetical protein
MRRTPSIAPTIRRATVELLDLLIARQALGFPETPHIIRVPPTWRRGPTLREAEQATA